MAVDIAGEPGKTRPAKVTADRIATINAFVEWWYTYGQDRYANAVGIAAAAFISELKGQP